MKSFNRYNPIGQEEIYAVTQVMESGCLSQFIGAWGDDFHGGPQVKAFETSLAEYFSSKHAITFNSLTSGLMAAVGAIGIQPGDEVIVSPWTMSATATAILIWGGIPVFADIEKQFYGLDPERVEALITPKTKAIMVTDIFGHGAQLDRLATLAENHGLKLIEDVAQAPGIHFKGKFCGTWGDIGGFSLNYHKHIHTGEGGFCITDDDELALKMKMIRNHAEASFEGSPMTDLLNMVGFNFRLGEMEAAIGRQQLIKLPALLDQNISKANIINTILSTCPDFKVAELEAESSHAFYVLPIQLVNHAQKREAWINALKEKGVPGLFSGYVNVHRLPMYEHKTAFGRNYPWCFSEHNHQYGKGICPVAEELKDESFVGLLISMFDMNNEDCQWIAETMVNVWNQIKIR